MRIFIGFIWEIITVQLSNLQYWQINKKFFSSSLQWVGGWELFALNFKTTFLAGTGLRNQEKNEERGRKGERKEGTWSLSWQDLSKEEISAKPPAPVAQPKEADGLTSKCRHWCSICCKLHIMPEFDAIIKNEGEFCILAPDSLAANSSSRRGYIP